MASLQEMDQWPNTSANYSGDGILPLGGHVELNGRTATVSFNGVTQEVACSTAQLDAILEWLRHASVKGIPAPEGCPECLRLAMEREPKSSGQSLFEYIKPGIGYDVSRWDWTGVTLTNVSIDACNLGSLRGATLVGCVVMEAEYSSGTYIAQQGVLFEGCVIKGLRHYNEKGLPSGLVVNS